MCHRIGYAAKNDTDGGFTLIEAIVSFVLLAVVSAASITAGVNALRSDNDTRDRVTAANLAQQDLENARALTYPQFPTAVAAHQVQVGTKKYTVQRSVTATCPALWTPGKPTSMTVTTTVTPPGSARPLTVATVIAC